MQTGPVSGTFLQNLRGLTATLERLRLDRQLEEAITCGADPLHLTVVFGIPDTTVIRWATNARHLRIPPTGTEDSSYTAAASAVPTLRGEGSNDSS
ncbi:hypothetical protein [Nocardia sp. CC227C]|uniref:hypothetical protein n=1 Tax=Nocardia sp. CC227C TaxID=3044562 RepID=UPI00278C3B5D|nr:hypothetical protein [Nocardia sp. CC227C]